MIGQTFEARPRFSIGSVIFLLIGVLFLTASMAQQNVNLAIFAILPITIAVNLWRVSRRRLVATLQNEHIELLEPQATIPYSDLKSVTLKQSKKPVLVVESTRGLYYIPHIIDVSLVNLYEFLVQRVPPQPPKQPHYGLQDYHAEQVATFGIDRVWIFNSISKGRRIIFQSGLKGLSVTHAMLLTGTLWCTLPWFFLDKEAVGWLGGGITLLIFGGLFWLLLREHGSNSKAAPYKLRNSCLIISPLGIAMIQGDLQGQLRWDEIRRVTNKFKSGSFRISNANTGLVLSIDGSQIVVMDIYDVSIDRIEDIIRRHR